MSSSESPEPMDLDSQEPEKSPMQLAYEEAKEVAATGDNDKAIKMFEKVIANLENDPSADAVKWAENSIYAMADCLVAKKDSQRLFGLQKELRPVLTLMAKAKTAKIVRTLIDKLAEIDGTTDLQIKACEDCIQWCREGKRSFLRHRVETRLADLELQIGQYNKALEILTGLVKEVKKLDDKLLLVEIHVIETKVHFALQNIPRAKASLTAAKTNANAIHCPPLMQAEMDLLSGVISCRENDFRTAYSYFYESYEAFNLQHDKKRAEQSLKYMVLSRIMGDQPGEVFNILKGKAGLKYGGGRVFDGLEKVAKAHEQRSLHDFEHTMQEYKKELVDEDPVLKYHLTELNESLLEQNLLKIIEPFDRIEIQRVAELIDLPLSRVQKKLSEMILDETLLGTLDQGIGVLVVYDELEVERVQKRKTEASSMYDDALATIDSCSNVVDSLYTKTTTMLFGNGGPKSTKKSTTAGAAQKTKGAAVKAVISQCLFDCPFMAVATAIASGGSDGSHVGSPIVLPGQKRCDFSYCGIDTPELVVDLERPLAVEEYLKARIRAFLRDPTLPALSDLCRVPPGVPRAVWYIENVREFMVEFNRVIAEVQTECNEESCPRMSATDEWHFLCAAHRKPVDCCAIDYIIHTVDGSTSLVLNPKNFPDRTKIPQSSLKFIPTIYRRLYRIFGHLFHHHRGIFFKVEAQSRMCARFTQFVRMHSLLGPSSSGGESSRTGSRVESNLYLVPDAAIGLLPTTPPIGSPTTSSEPSPKAEAALKSCEDVEGKAESDETSVDDGEASDAETVFIRMTGGSSDVDGFGSLGLSSTTLRSLSRMKYEQAAPVQREAIPLGLSWTDLIIQSKSGTGKTCAFGVIVCELTTPQLGLIQSLILAPSREIVNQIREEVSNICYYSQQLVTTVEEFTTVKTQHHVSVPDIIIGTAKQMYLLFRQRHVPVCADAGLLVLDEAD
ncbi:26S proteasome non-ATPase regulatory subunit 11, partial [Perkinsus chesapeaki]